MRICRAPAQGLRLHDVGVHRGAVTDRPDAACEPAFVDVDDQFEPEFARDFVAECDHFAEFPGRIDMQQRKWQLPRIERLQSQVQKHRGIFADRVEHDRVVALSDSLTYDVDAFGFEMLKMRECRERPAGRGLHLGETSSVHVVGPFHHDWDCAGTGRVE